LLAEEDEEAAARVAGAAGALLALVTAVLTLVGIWATPWLIDGIAPGFAGEKRELTIRLVRILFPGMALLVLSAWCLGILNSHRRFLLSYTAPVAWNAAIIAALMLFGGRVGAFDLAAAAAWGAVAGSALQLLVQVPTVWRVAGRLRPSLDVASEHVRTVLRNFGPVFVGRGVLQISAYIDTILGSLLPAGSVTALMNAQTLYTLPVSLFGMSVSAAELPVMSSAQGDQEAIAAYLRTRLDAGLRRIAFFVVPSAMAFVALGDVLAAALFQTGRFTGADATYVWSILAGSAVGLLASTMGRLYASTYYALRDTRTPLRFAVVRVTLGTALGFCAALLLPGALGVDPRWGAAGLAAASGIAGWTEFLLLRRTLRHRIGRTGLAPSHLARLWIAAAAAAAAGLAVKLGLGVTQPILRAGFATGAFGAVYLLATWAIGVNDSRTLVRRLMRRAN
jgi:putative peptidoglycan lipid II flippase